MRPVFNNTQKLFFFFGRGGQVVLSLCNVDTIIGMEVGVAAAM